MSSKSSWKQEDCFPIVFEIIQKLSSDKRGGWITHEELVEVLLKDISMMSLVTLAKIHLYKGEEIDEKSIVSNMVAWFSQKITEYERGKLLEDYSQYLLIEEAWKSLDRKVIENRYSYRVRCLPRETPIVVKEKRQQKLILEAKKREFNRLVNRMKELGVPGELFREVTILWFKDKEKTLSLLSQRGYNIKLDELGIEEAG